MAVSATPMRISKVSQAAFQQFFNSAWNMCNVTWNIREQLRLKDIAYMREQDNTNENWKARLANLYGDPNKFQNITVPVVEPQVESALTYFSSVFLTGNPIFGVTASPMYSDAALQMDAIMEENSLTGQWAAELLMWARDGLKYNISALEVTWENKITAQLETDASFSTAQGKPKEVVWAGNSLKRWDMYNTFWDTRVAPRDVPEKGEFIGRTELMSRVALKQFIATLPDKIIQNITAAFESGASGSGNLSFDKYYVPFVNPMALISTTDPRATTDWMAWAGLTQGVDQLKIRYNNMYQVQTLYCRIIPADFGLQVPAPNTPQIWKIILVNGQIVIYAERQTNAHNLLPVIMHQPKEDGLDYQTKSFADNVLPFQQVATALLNSAIAARRRAISDRAVYDPTRIEAKEINNPAPNAKIPVKPAAYGKDLREAIFPIPFRDDISPMALQEMQQILNLANIASGQNQAQQGQFVKGNKTLHEYADVMQNANGRNQNMCIGYEMRSFSRIKEMLKLNILQYQQSTTIYSVSKQSVTQIDPVVLRNAITAFKISDGLLPSDKLISSDAFGTFMQYGMANPAFGQEYNMSGVMSYLLKMQGADLKPFEKSEAQKAYEQAMNQWQQVAMQYAQAKMPFNIPQPTPQQYGYIPEPDQGQDYEAGAKDIPAKQSILQQVMAAQQEEQQEDSQQQQNGAAQPGSSGAPNLLAAAQQQQQQQALNPQAQAQQTAGKLNRQSVKATNGSTLR